MFPFFVVSSNQFLSGLPGQIIEMYTFAGGVILCDDIHVKLLSPHLHWLLVSSSKSNLLNNTLILQLQLVFICILFIGFI